MKASLCRPIRDYMFIVGHRLHALHAISVPLWCTARRTTFNLNRLWNHYYKSKKYLTIGLAFKEKLRELHISTVTRPLWIFQTAPVHKQCRMVLDAALAAQLFHVDMLRPTLHVVSGNGKLSLWLCFEQPISLCVYRPTQTSVTCALGNGNFNNLIMHNLLTAITYLMWMSKIRFLRRVNRGLQTNVPIFWSISLCPLHPVWNCIQLPTRQLSAFRIHQFTNASMPSQTILAWVSTGFRRITPTITTDNL